MVETFTCHTWEIYIVFYEAILLETKYNKKCWIKMLQNLVVPFHTVIIV